MNPLLSVFSLSFSLSDTILNCISVQRGLWKSLAFQDTHGHDAPLDRPSRTSRPKHQPDPSFRYDQEPPSRFPTRDCYPKLGPDEIKATRERLEDLRIKTPLSRSGEGEEVGVVYTYDEVMEDHYCTTVATYPECPARTKVRQSMPLIVNNISSILALRWTKS